MRLKPTKKSKFHKITTIIALAVVISACDKNQEIQETQHTPSGFLLNNTIQNSAASYIPAQCYTKTQGHNQRIHNPCFSCHTQPVAPNYIEDADFQRLYDFRDTTRKNPYLNLFKDRTQAMHAISDEKMIQYIRQSNYFAENNQLLLAEKLKNLPKEWDVNQDGKWSGYLPDVYFNFDNEGFDIDPQGKETGWRAFAYAPFLGTFWPTNGSTDDVLIRLAKVFRQDNNGDPNREIYRINLAIVESLIKRKHIQIAAVNENQYQVDLNRNGTLDTATQITFQWSPKQKHFMSYVGQAKQLYDKGKLPLAAGLYPLGTEFIHSVRYIDFDENNDVILAKRFKELRYGKKLNWNTYAQLRNADMDELKEADDFPDRLRQIQGNSETGLWNGKGWLYQGFIEDQQGALRPQSYEESLSCVGCHSGLGVTTDSSFAFERKLNFSHFQQGWYHWDQKSLKNTPEPRWSDGTYEYAKYLLENQSGNEFRTNTEIQNKFFDKQGKLIPSEAHKVRDNISYLLWPSKERAMQLNKAYQLIVKEQSYIYGRDVHIKPLDEVVWKAIPENETTGIQKVVIRH